MDALHPEIAAYMERLPEEAAGYRPSVFWQRILDGRETVQHLLGSAVREASAERPAAEQAGYRDAFELAATVDREAQRLKRMSRAVDKHEWEHAQALSFLRRRSLLGDYAAFLDLHRLRSSMVMARHFWHGRLLSLAQDLLTQPLRVVEIGGGPAWLSVRLSDLLDIEHYTIIELPQNVVQGAYVAARWLPGRPLNVGTLGDGWSFVPPRVLDTVEDGTVDLVVNVSSFMEMDRDARDGYIAAAYRVLRPGGLFFNVNRRQRTLPQPDGSTFDNNPLLYPYRPSDRVLLWEEDEFQQAVRARHQAVPSLAIVRAALV